MRWIPRLPPPAVVAQRAQIRAAAWTATDGKIKQMVRAIIIMFIELLQTNKYDKTYGKPLLAYKQGLQAIDRYLGVHPDKALERNLCAAFASWIHQTQKHNRDIEKRARNQKKK